VTRTMTAKKHPDDVGPNPEMELEYVEDVEFAPDFRIVLEVPFDSDALAGLSDYARAHGLNAIEAVQRLVSEALSAHARR
jgi:hypothetical protein